MAATHDTPIALLGALAGSDPTRPRLTWYDDGPGATAGERVELSGRVLANWVAKAANLLQEDLDLGPGRTLAVDLPGHWRTAYWLFAGWSVGANVVVLQPDSQPDLSASAEVVVTMSPQRWDQVDEVDQVVAVSRAALGRVWTGEPLRPGVVDEAKELATYGDRFAAWSTPSPDEPALTTTLRQWTYGELLPSARAESEVAGLAPGARVLTSSGPDEAVTHWLPAWAVDGSVVLVRPGGGADLDHRVEVERVTDRV